MSGAGTNDAVLKIVRDSSIVHIAVLGSEATGAAEPNFAALKDLGLGLHRCSSLTLVQESSV